MAPPLPAPLLLLLLLPCWPRLSLAAWDYSGRLPEWRPAFPDYDCHGGQVGLLGPPRLLEEALESAAAGGADHPEGQVVSTDHSTGNGVNWSALRDSAEAAAPTAWPRLVLTFGVTESRRLERAQEALEDWRQPECFLGLLFGAAVRYAECAGQGFESCADEELLAKVVQGILRATPFELLLGTRWPVFAALDSLRLPMYDDDPTLSCEGLPTQLLDWPRLRRAFEPSKDWFHDAKKLVYAREFQAAWVGAMDECAYGFAMVSLWKLIVCAETQAECVNQYSVFIDDLLRTRDWREVAGNSWRPFGFMARVQGGIRRHDFRLDFLPGELQGNLSSAALPPSLIGPQQLVSSRLSDAVAAGAVSEAFAGVLASVLAGTPRHYVAAIHDGRTEMRKLLYVTMVFGPRYVPYIPRFVSRAAALGITNLVLFCLDGAAFEACSELPGSRTGAMCVRGTPSILNKFTLPLAYLSLGVDVFWLDFDVFLMKDPTPAVLELAREKSVDLLVSGSFADDCICSGLVFFRATEVMATWLLTLLSWMYEHVYTHDQQAFSAFLGGRPDEDNLTRPERISSSKLFKLYLEVEVPRWALLDPVVAFPSARVLNTTGWTGEVEDMYIFHFLHGDSEVNRDHRAYGWNQAHGFGTDRALLDIFYNQTDERLYQEPSPPYEYSQEILEALLASRRTSRPAEMLHCGVLELNPYTPGRMSADG